jgi:hypothetical protein
MYTPFSDGGNVGPLVVEGRPELPPGQNPVTRRNWITPGYLESMSIPIVAGRSISHQDSAGVIYLMRTRSASACE